MMDTVIKAFKKAKGFKVFSKILLWVYCFISIYPLIWMLFYSLKNNDEIFVTNPFGFPTHFRFENYISAWTNFSIPIYFKNSTIVAVFMVIGSIALSLPFAYSVARMRWKLRDTARVYMTFGMFVPVQAILIPLTILIRNFHLFNTYASLIIPYIAFNLSFASIVFYGFLRGIPDELEESACIDGASIYRTFISIIVPVVKPAIATMIIFMFLSSWNDFIIAYTLISDEAMKTLPLGLLLFQGQFTTDWGAMGACMTIASLPTVLIYILFSEQVEKALTVGAAVKG